MGRSTQYIGLNDASVLFVKEAKLKEVESDHCVYGMFDEKIKLRKWVTTENTPSNINTCCKYIKEMLQDMPWSSGPMIFTCLEIFQGAEDETDEDLLYRTPILEWVLDPSITSEIDKVRGRYWV